MDANNKIVGFDVDWPTRYVKIDASCTFTNQAFDSLIPQPEIPAASTL